MGFLINSSGYGTKMKLYDLIVTAATVGVFEESVFKGLVFKCGTDLCK